MIVTEHLLELEARKDSVVSGEGCYALSANLSDWDPLIVSGGMVFRTKAAFVDTICANWNPTQIGAGFGVEKETVEIMSLNSALVVREGIGMVRYEGQDEIRFHLVGTGVWVRESESWIRLHYHESCRDLEDE